MMEKKGKYIMNEQAVSDTSCLEQRKSEMRRDILPGFMTNFTLPVTGKSVKIYSRKSWWEEK